VQPQPELSRQVATPRAVSPRELRQALGAFATGVTVITVGGDTPHGMTANSFTSVSLEPPLVLVCVERDAVMHSRLLVASGFGVSVLAHHQQAVARYFADRHRPLGHAQFESFDWAPGPLTGAPRLAGALAYFECEQWRSYDGGDHTIFVARLLSLDRRSAGQPLLFLDGKFRTLDDNRPLGSEET
jgi:flavin reductase (DIM6/NTAB) family NADH-FMN oxidoreductase RutF